MNPESNENNSDVLNLESFNTEYKNLLIEYKLAVSNYVNYLKQEVKRPCVEYTGDTKGISQECYNDIWKKSGCGSGTLIPDANSSWASSQTLNGLINDAWLWATMPDYNHRMGCYGNPGNSYVIIGVGLTTTALYTVALFTDQDTQIIGSTWSNMFGILLTNAFSIVGTIMGVKYASEKPKKN